MNRPDRAAASPDPDGLLLVDKPPGMTSHDVVYKIRRTFGLQKVGHGGTLDPAATGLLVLLIGRGTKASDQVMAGDKIYEGEVTLGADTSTQDAEGEIIAQHDPSGVTREAFAAELRKWVGNVEQTPPMVSAVKIGGKRLYKLAREGVTVERQPRPVTIHSLDLLEWNPPRATIRMHCTKGTYVRTLAADVGAGLGVGGHLSALRRIASGDYHVDHALPLDQLLALAPPALAARLLPLPPKPAAPAPEASRS